MQRSAALAVLAGEPGLGRTKLTLLLSAACRVDSLQCRHIPSVSGCRSVSGLGADASPEKSEKTTDSIKVAYLCKLPKGFFLQFMLTNAKALPSLSCRNGLALSGPMVAEGEVRIYGTGFSEHKLSLRDQGL